MTSYKSLAFCLFATMMVILLVFCGNGEAKRIENSHDGIESLGYGVIAKDRILGCNFHNPKKCIKNTVNHYRRGCGYLTRCHRSSNGRS